MERTMGLITMGVEMDRRCYDLKTYLCGWTKTFGEIIRNYFKILNGQYENISHFPN